MCMIKLERLSADSDKAILLQTMPLYILQSIISKQLSRPGGKLYVAFVDFKKCFDLIHRDKLWTICMENGFTGNQFKTMNAMYKSVQACVRTSSGVTDFFRCPVGLKQGCLASPVLFVDFIN